MNSAELEKERERLLDSDIYFLKDLRNQIDHEDRYSVFLPEKHLSIERAKSFGEVSDELKITIPGLETKDLGPQETFIN